MLFAIGSHPFFEHMRVITAHINKVDPHAAITCCCADDATTALASFRYLSLLQPVLQKAEEYAGLKLKPSKCVMYPDCLRQLGGDGHGYQSLAR